VATLLSAVVFLVLIGATRVVSLGSMSALVALPPLTAWLGASPMVVGGACAAAVFVAFRHRTNMRRVWLGTERRLGQGL
jgi:glycerol-3-phosphate acyltransferase PlsY